MQSHTKLQSAWVVILDLACLVFSIFLAVVLRFGPEDMAQYVSGRLDGWVLFVASVLIANYLAGSYRVQYTLSRFNLLVTWLFSVGVAVLILSVTSYAWLKVLLGRGVLGLAVVLYSAFSLYLRLVLYHALFRIGHIRRRVVMVEDGEIACRLRTYLENPFVLPRHQVVAWVQLCDAARREPAGRSRLFDDLPVVDAMAAELPDVLRSLGADMLVLHRPPKDGYRALHGALREIRYGGSEVITPLMLSETFCGRTSLDLIQESDIMQVGLEAGVPALFRLKRIMDLVCVVLGSIVIIPLAALTALLIKFSEPLYPVLYSQERVGQFGRIFKIRKFRTMHPEAEAETGAVWSPLDDPRVTPIGRFLRAVRLDELPQMWNVLMGDMSLVGPRPERPELASRLADAIPYYHEREYAQPGLTGWAQIHCPYSNSVEASRRKLEYDLFYLRNLSLSLDLQIILRTIRIVLFGKEKHV